MSINSFGNDERSSSTNEAKPPVGSHSESNASSANESYFRYAQLEKRPKSKITMVRFLITIISVLIIFDIFLILFKKEQPQIKAVLISSSNIAQSAENILGIEMGESESLRGEISKSIEGAKGTYSVTVKNLKTGEEVNIDGDKKYDAGSLYKLWVMVTVYNKISEGSLKEDQVLSADIATLNKKFSIDPEFAEQKEGGITLSVNAALKQMITISHNYAALLLTEKVRLSAVSLFLSQNRFKESKVGTATNAPQTTSSDTAIFFEKLYQGELADKEATTKMLELLKQQRLNKKLPKYLPGGTIIAHKTGELGRFTHDAGIVYSDKGDYIIVVLSESASPAGAEDRIAKVSEVVYEYFKEN